MIQLKIFGRVFRFKTLNAFQSFMVAALASLMLTMAVFNADGYVRDGLVIMAALALACEAIGFAATIILEVQAHKKRWLAVGVWAFTLIVCSAMNIAGGDRAWRANEQRRVEAVLTVERAALVSAQRPFAEARDAAQRALDAFGRVDCAGVGPATCRSRTEAWQTQTVSQRAALVKAQQDLDAHPLGTPAPVAPLVPDWSVDALLGCIEIIKVLGLWATGLELMPAPISPKRKMPNMGQILVARRRDRPAFRERLIAEYGPDIMPLLERNS